MAKCFGINQSIIVDGNTYGTISHLLQAISILLEEESSENAQGMLQSNQRSIVFSEGYTQLNSQLSFLKGRHVVHAQFHPVQTNLLLTVHSASKKVNCIKRVKLQCGC